MSRRKQWAEDSTVKVELSAGASVTVAFHGNCFDLTTAERKLVADLTDVIHTHRDAQGLTALEVEEEAKRA